MSDENQSPSVKPVKGERPEEDSQSSLNDSEGLGVPVFHLPETIAALLRAPPPRAMLSSTDDWGNDEGDPTTFGFLDFMPSENNQPFTKESLYSSNILDQEAPFTPSNDSPPPSPRKKMKRGHRFLFCA
ncbi:MAG: hypothetical protein Q8P67_15145 [archaeon]|nr:hypothetical protein [archaeon]